MPRRSHKEAEAVDAVGMALSTISFRRRFAEAGHDVDAEALAREELERQKVDLTGFQPRFDWDPARRKLCVTLEPDPRLKKAL